MNYEQLFRLDGRIAVVIGAGSGIGQAAAKGLAAHGAFVVCADVSRDAAELTAGELGQERGRALTVDVTSTQSVSELLQGVVGEDGRIDESPSSIGASAISLLPPICLLHTPRASAPQIYLCSCNCIRSSIPLSAIQFAS